MAPRRSEAPSREQHTVALFQPWPEWLRCLEGHRTFHSNCQPQLCMFQHLTLHTWTPSKQGASPLHKLSCWQWEWSGNTWWTHYWWWLTFHCGWICLISERDRHNWDTFLRIHCTSHGSQALCCYSPLLHHVRKSGLYTKRNRLLWLHHSYGWCHWKHPGVTESS